jgi:type IV pilus assembly protein PilY1
MKTRTSLNIAAKVTLLALSFCAAITTSALTIPNIPLTTKPAVKPMVMLVAGKDHRFFYEAYNDASDVDGDGTLDIRFKPTITYLGLFNPIYCYSHNGDNSNTGRFTPSSTATGLLKKCSGAWSGNWLNYITTSRIDALKVVLYGGTREVDGTGTSSTTGTTLRRSYIPQDAHSWAKEYTSLAVDKYLITDYTPLDQPKANRRHFFGNLTPTDGVNCATLSDCSDLPPWMSVVEDSTKRVWEWASTERPVLQDATHGGSRKNYTVRVRVCRSGYRDGCKQYGTTTPVFKPTGILHDYAESNSMLFGLMSGSYDKNTDGGRLRKVMSDFKDEVNQTTGQFNSSAPIVQSFDSLRIRDFNNGNTSNEYRNGFNSATRPMNPGEFKDWGNPIAEMMYEAVRYFSGKGSATTDFAGSTTIDQEVGLPSAAWDNPYSASSTAKAPSCARANMLVISDVNVSFDSDKLPGSFFGSFSSDLPGLDVSSEATFITGNEPGAVGSRFIGQAGAISDSTPSPKNVTNLGQLRGLAPEEPTKQGSYYSASVAYYAKKTDLQPSVPGKQSVDTFVVALASPLPRINAKLPNGKTATLVPFAKSVSGAGISNTKGNFQPTNQIVDFYVEQIANSGPQDVDLGINGGRYYAKFRINFEDVEQGADHDMDAIVEYTVVANSDNTVTVNLNPIYEAGGIQHRIGYIMSGTTKDGVYLVVQDESDSTPYFLNTPPGRDPGYCDVTVMPADCNRLPYLGGPAGGNSSNRIFSPSSTPTATFLNDPLWYAAKWGGYKDANSNDKPDLTSEWDADGDGIPDTYLMVQNPLKLKESLKKSLDEIVARTSSGSNVSANSTSIASNTRLYQALFNTQRWSGNVIAYPAVAGGVGSTPSWEASAVGTMPAPAARKIFMRTSDSTTAAFSSYAALSAADKTAFGSNADIFDYLKGVRTNEVQSGGTLRNRESALGDIINSSPSYEKDTNTVYVGANDGMLHAFDGASGVEKFAFIPRQSVSRMKDLADVAYAHQYFVDGDVVVTPRIVETSSKNYLFSVLGRGGKGLFSVDATSPDTFSTSSFLWEYTPAGNTAAAADTNLGLMLGRPIFAKLNNGKAGLIVGNGYNSSSGTAVLYIFIINANGTLDSVKKIDTAVGGDNGLAGPAFVDTDSNGTADAIYAGDLKGNVWKFNISSASPASWNVAFGGLPMFQAQDAGGTAQPITASMYTALNDRTGDPNQGKRFVFFGTGTYFKDGDALDTQTQSWYGIVEQTAPIAGRSALKQRSISQKVTTNGLTSRSFGKAVANDMVSKAGWYLDWNNPLVGERIVTTSKIAKFTIPALIATSLYPVPADPCLTGGLGFLNLIDPYSGGGLELGVIDANRDNDFTNDVIVTEQIGSTQLSIGIPSEPLVLDAPGGKKTIYIGGSGTGDAGGGGGGGPSPDCIPGQLTCINALGGKIFKGRLSWREIVRD